MLETRKPEITIPDNIVSVYKSSFKIYSELAKINYKGKSCKPWDSFVKSNKRVPD